MPRTDARRDRKGKKSSARESKARGVAIPIEDPPPATCEHFNGKRKPPGKYVTAFSRR